MKVAELENIANEVNKSLNGESNKEKEPENQLTLLGKALDIIGSVLPKNMSKALFGPQAQDEENEDAEEKKPVKKSGETKQPHGDQNHLNSGEMSSSKKIPKKFNYEEKMEEQGVEEPDNTKVHYKGYENEHGVHKSLDQALEEADDADKVFVVNDFLNKALQRQEIQDAKIDALQKSLDTLLYANGILLKSIQANMQKSMSTGRGRITMLNANDKPLAQKSVVNEQPVALNRMSISDKMLKAQKAGKLTFNQVSEGETWMNEYGQLPPYIEQVIADV